MPATVKVKVIAARDLPVMDRTSDLTDAFVEIRLGNTTFKTDVVRQTLNPKWNSDWFCFELNEESLLKESLKIRVLDHDTYSAHDAIGRVYFDLTPLLRTEQKRSLNGWFPLYDTMQGIRGEIKLTVRIDLFSDAYRQRFSPLGIQFFFSSALPSGHRVIKLIGFVRELVMNDDPEHQWIEKIRTSRASNEARQCLFSQLSGEIQSKLSRKVLNSGGNAVIGYRLHFDLEGDTGIVARAIGTAAQLQRASTESPPQALLLKKKLEGNDRDVGSDLLAAAGNDVRTRGDDPIEEPSPSSPKLLSDAEFPFLTISHPPRGLIRHFGSMITVKSVKLLDKNSAGTRNLRASWWLELQLEALTRMYSVGCDALIGYREECAIYQDLCVLSISATMVTLNQQWVHLFNSSNSQTTRPEGVAGNIQSVSERDLRDKNKDSSLSNLSRECSICHIPALNRTLPVNKSMKCRVCRVAFVPEFLLCTTNFPSGLPVIGRPSFVQVGLSRSKKEEKGESAAREISELLPYIEYELHYRLIQKLRLQGMNAIFGLSIQLAIGKDLVAVMATGTGVYISALPSARLPKVCSNISTLDAEIMHNLETFNNKCRDLFGIPHDSMQVEYVDGHGISEPLRNGFKQGEKVETALGAQGSTVHLHKSPTTDEMDQIEYAKTYFVDARKPEPEELDTLISEPLPPHGLLFMTTDNPPSDESFIWLDKMKRERSDFVASSFFGRRIHSFMQVYTVQGLEPDDSLGSIPSHYLTSGSPIGDISSLTNLRSSAVLESTLNVSLVNKSMAKCLCDCNQLTGFYFRGVMPCVITSLAYRLTIIDDDVVRISCSGAALSLSNEEPILLKNCPPGLSAKWEGQKLSIANARRNLFTRPKGLRSTTAMELKAIGQVNDLEGNDYEQTAVKHSTKKIKWWQSFSRAVATKSAVNLNSNPSSDGRNDQSSTRNDSGLHEDRCTFTPSPNLINRKVIHYLGKYSFFFVRETTDLREMGGLRCFVHAAVMEAQSVAAAHTIGLGGNALLSYQMTELLITRPASRNQAQCLINLCGDMAQICSN